MSQNKELPAGYTPTNPKLVIDDITPDQWDLLAKDSDMQLEAAKQDAVAHAEHVKQLELSSNSNSMP